MCIHSDKRHKSRCRECHGSSFCIHDKFKSTCRECHGSSFCIHDKIKSTCRECGGSQICIHDKIKRFCRECGGSSFCIHGKQKSYCITCSPNSNTFCKNCRLFLVKKRTNYLCSYCNPEKAKRMKTKENQIRQLLEDNKIIFTHDKMIINECCLKYRPDFLIDCKTFFLIIEVDEDAHKWYPRDCEEIRMNNISHSLGLPTKFIRYNPDNKAYRKKYKERILLEKIQEIMNFDVIEDLQAEYLFY